MLTEVSGSHSTNCLLFPRTFEGHTVAAASRRRSSRSGTETNVKEELTSGSQEATGTGGGGGWVRATWRKEGWQLSDREVSPSDDWSVARWRHRCALVSLMSGICCFCTLGQTDRENGAGVDCQWIS